MASLADKSSQKNAVQQGRGDPRSGAAPLISVIIVSYNVKDFLQQALLSLRKALQTIDAEIFVVDNASDDGSINLVREQFPEVILIANESNLGFAKANNVALQHARGDYVVLINPDTIAQEDTFTRLLDFMQHHPDAGMVGCKILNPDGSLQLACRRSYPTPWVAFTRLTGLSFLFPKSRWFGKYNLSYLPENEIAAVEAISGSFMLLRREAFEQVGLLDEDFFLYGEDLDWCYRITQAGWHIYYVPSTQIIHFKGESSKRSRLDSMLVFYRAMSLFVKKHFRGQSFGLTYYLLHLAIWLRAGFSFVKNSLAISAVPALDLALLQISLLLALFVKFGHLQFWANYLPVNAVYSAVWMAALYAFGSYGRWKFSFYRASLATLSGFLFNSALTYFFKQYAFSRAVVLLAGGTNLVLLGGWRLIYKLLNRIGLAPFRGPLGHTLLARRSLVVGDFSQGERVLEKLKTRVGSGYDIVGLVSLNPADVGLRYNGLEVIGTIGSLPEIVRRRNIREVIFSTHRIAYDRILKVISESRSSRVSFKLIPSNLEVIIGKASIDQLTDVPLLDIDYKLAQPSSRAVKRFFDFSVATACLLLGLPFFAFAMLFFGRRLHKQEVLPASHGSPAVAVYQMDGISWIGKLLWLWPVLCGKLSLVGSELVATRPDAPRDILLKPGLTGLVQVNLQRDLTADEKEKYNLFYLMHYSPLLDLEILFKSIFKI